MNRTKITAAHLLAQLGFAAVTTLVVGSTAYATDQDAEALREIAQLRAELTSIRSEASDQWLTEQRAAEIRGIVTDVLADADTRTSLQGSAAGSGYNGGFFLSSADGNYSMKVNVLEQIRWTYDSRNGDPEGKENNWGFENKRTRLTWSGNIVDSTWSYALAYYFAYANDVEFDNGTGGADATVGLADAWVAKDLGNGCTLTVGQFKLPFSGEYSLEAGNLQFNDYSSVSNVFAEGYGQGLMFGYQADSFRVAAAYVNALNETNDQFSNATPETEAAFTGRAAVKLQGNWDQFNNAQSFKGEEMGILVGAGFSWEKSNSSADEIFGFTADATFDFGGANVMAAFYWDNEDDGFDTINPYGYTLQGGVFVTDNCELVVRYEFASWDEAGDTDFSALTIGGNHYFARNTAKLGVNFGYAFDTVSIYWWEHGAAGNNWLPDTDSDGFPTDEDGQWMIQGQLSFSF